MTDSYKHFARNANINKNANPAHFHIPILKVAYKLAMLNPREMKAVSPDGSKGNSAAENPNETPSVVDVSSSRIKMERQESEWKDNFEKKLEEVKKLYMHFYIKIILLMFFSTQY